MRAGSLDREITIQDSTTTRTPGGGVSYTWTDQHRVRASIISATTEEFMRSFGASSESVMIFRTRYVPGVKLAHRIAFEGEHFNIKEIKELGRRRGLEIRTVRTGA